MTEEEKIKTYFDAYGYKWGAKELVRHIRRHLVEIEKLLEEPEPKSGTVVRLTDLCNRLEEENHKLKDALAGDQVYIEELREELNVTSKSNAFLRGCLNRKQETLEILKQRNDELEQNLNTVERLVGNQRARSALKDRCLEQAQSLLEERLTFKDQSLRACRAAEEILKKRYDRLEMTIAATQPYAEELRKDLAR